MTTEFHSIDELLTVMVERNASDLHLTAGSPPVIRVNGSLERLPETRPRAGRHPHARLPDPVDRAAEAARDAPASTSPTRFPGVARFRVNAYYQRMSLGAAFRIIPTRIKSLEELGLPERLYELGDKPRGLVLVTGPTGSGKSTTLAALIHHINRTRTSTS